MGRIVVGIDDSKGARAALAWAAEEAKIRGTSLEVVHAYDPPQNWWALSDEGGMTAASSAAVREQLAQASERAEHEARAFVDEITSSLDVDSSTVVAEAARPAVALLDRAKGADLLVVGSRGRGGFTGLLLGSVSQQCAAHAPCPVVIIHADDQ